MRETNKKRLNIVGYPMFISMFLLMLLFGSGCTTFDSRSLSADGQKADLAPDPRLITGTLPNGFTYYLYENAEPTDRVSMHLAVDAGSFQETEEQKGLAHFLEHMVFNGSTNFKPGELVKYFQEIGMDFGGDANAHTGFFETVYDLNLPSGDPLSVKKALVVFQDYAGGALLIPEEIEREKPIILAEKRTRDSVSYRTFVERLKATLPDSRLSQRLPIGDSAIIQGAGQKELRDYYETWYRPENLSLVMVGDFDAKIIEKAVVDAFFGMRAKRGKIAKPSLDKIKHKGVVTFYHREAESGDTRVSIEAARIVPNEIDSLDLQRRLLIRYLSSSIMQNRLDSMVVGGKAPFVGAYIHSGPYFQELEFSKISANGPQEKWKSTLAVIEQELRRGLTHGFTAAELERVKLNYIADLEDSVTSAPTRDSGKIARELLYSVNMDRVYTSSKFDLDNYGPMLADVQVEDVNRAFREAWNIDHRFISVTGNVEIASVDPEYTIDDVYSQSSLVQVLPPKNEKDVKFPYAKAPKTPGVVADQGVIEDLDIETVLFENGLKLNLKRTDFKVDEISFNLFFGKGKSGEPANKPGLSILAPMVINGSGLGPLSVDQLGRALTGKRTSISFDVRETGFKISGSSVSKEIPLMFQLMRAQITDYSVDEDALSLARRKLEKKYARLSKTVEGTMALSGYRYLAGGDNRFGFPDLDQVKSYNAVDIRRWVDEGIKGSDLELSVVGDFDKDEVIRMAALYLGTLPASENKLKERSDLPVFPKAGSVAFNVNTSIDRALVAIAFPTDDYWDIKQTRRLTILAEVLSERMREIIREKLGVAYSASAYNYSSLAYDGYGLLNTFVPVGPKDAALVVEQIKLIAEDLRKNGITKEELKRSLGPVLVGLKEQVRSNQYWLNSVMTGMDRNPERLDWSRTLLSDFSSISPQEISMFARKYLDTGKAVTIIIKPESQVIMDKPSNES